MKELSIDTVNNQFVEFWSNMMECELDSYYNPDALKMTLSVSAAALKEDSGCAYPGALLVHINLVVAIAKRLAAMISGTFSINMKSLIKICILQNLSKSTIFKINDNEWEVKQRGLNYTFSELDGRMKCGSRSLFYAVNNGIRFDAVEWEAMESIDRENDNKGAMVYDDPLTTIIRQANELAYLVERGRYKNDGK